MMTRVLVCLALIALARAGPANYLWRGDYDPVYDSDSSTSCAKQCKGQSNKFEYQPGTTYSYDYLVATETSMAGASEDTAKLYVEARADIQSIDRCEFVLSIKNVRVFHSDIDTTAMKEADRKDEFKRALERNDLHFSFDDGVISSICPNTEEEKWVLNFKRGLLSAFQNSMEDFDKDQKVPEVDVTGECEAEYKVQKSWGWNKQIKITKSKNMVACSKRDGYKSIYQFTPYKVPSDIQSLPIMKGTHECEFEIDDQSKTLKKASCVETHVFAPFSNNESGGKTKVTQKMEMKSQRQGVDASRDYVKDRRSLLFEHALGHEEYENRREAAQQKLKEICEQTRDDIRPETPRLYTELVRIVQDLSKAELEQIYQKVKANVICPENDRTLKFFLDALPVAETSGAVGMMVSLINNKEVDDMLAKAWLPSLAVIQEANSEMIEESVSLLKGPYSENAYLPVSSLVNNFCRKSPSCGDDFYVSQVVEFFNNKIPTYCQTDDSNLEEILKTLRAIGNLGQTKSKSIVPSLKKCMNSAYPPLEVKVAAADAFHRLPCDEGDDELFKVMKDSDADSELKITAYLSLMRCPTSDKLKQIAQLLEDVDDEQVGVFIYSHINNLKETSDPLKQDAAKLARSMTFKEFELNPIKYSSNYEASFLINKLNLGLTSDNHVIMSSKSPIPRSGKFNLTVNLFGKSVNILEGGIRAENVEYLVERLLGPYGYFPKSKGQGDDKLDEVRASIFARLFGNEIFFEHVKGAKDLTKAGKMPNFLDMLIKISNRQEVSYTHSQQIMDVALIIPTAAGLPLNITVNTSLSLDLKAEGKADLRRVSSSPRSLEIDGEIKPSAALEVTGAMAVDAFVAKLGLRMRNTMHSSTFLKGRININRGRELDIEIEPPGDKMEIFSAKSQFFIIHNQVEKEQEMIKDNRKDFKYCTGDKLAYILGVELCGELSFPNASAHPDAPYYPLTGPSSVSFITYRRDTHTSYKLLAKRSENKKNSIAQFLMDTPNSRVNRMISTDVTIGYEPEKTVDIVLVSPWKRVKFNSALVANNDIVSLTGNVILDDSDKYGLTTEVKISDSSQDTVYTPFIEVTNNGKVDTLLSGQVAVSLPKTVDVNLDVKGLSNLPINVKGSLRHLSKEERVSVIVSHGKDEYKVNVGANIDRSGKDNRNIRIEPQLEVKTPSRQLIDIKGTADYKSEKSFTGDLSVDIYRMKPASVDVRFKQIARPKQSRYDLDVRVKSSIFTGNLDTTGIQRRNVLVSKIKLNYNIPRVGKDAITWNTKFNDRSRNAFKKYTLSSNFDTKRNPDYNAGIKFDLDHKKKHSGVDVEIKYGANPKDKKKTVVLSSSLSRNVKNLKNMDLDLKLSAQAPEKDVDFSMKTSHSHDPQKLEHKTNLKFVPLLQNDIDANIFLRDRSDKLTKLTGKADISAMGNKYTVDTDLIQKSAKQYVHTLDVDSAGSKHSINTVYRTPDSDEHEITSDLKLAGFKPMTLQGKTSLNPSNSQALLSATKGKDVYSMSAQSKIAKDKAGKWNFEVVYPDRQIQLEAEGKNEKDKYSGSINLNWDAAKKSGKNQASIDGFYKHSANDNNRLIDGEINVKSPFEDFQDLHADASYSSDPSQYNTKGKISWGGKQDTLASSLFVKRPISIRNTQITFTAESPFRNFREVELEVDHKMDPVFDSSVKTKVGKEEAELSVKGEDRGNTDQRDFYGTLNLKTPMPTLRDLTLYLQHKDDARQYQTDASIEHNGDKYEGNVNMNHGKYGDRYVNNGQLKLSLPKDEQYVASWNHDNDGTKKIKCSMKSTKNGRDFITVDLDGSNEADYYARLVKGTAVVTTPFGNSRKIEINADNKFDSNGLTSTATLHHNNRQKAAYELNLESAGNSKNARFLLITPLYDEKIHGQVDVNANSYPSTAIAWLEWAPGSRIDFDGSVNTPSIDNMNVDSKLTTPFRNLRNIIVKASHKLEDAEYVTHAILDYGVRKMIEFENRLRNDDDVKLLRTKLTSPSEYLRSLNTGVRLETNPDGFDGNADFELQPYVGKYDGLVHYDYDYSDYNGKLELNTPHQALPSLQVNSWSKRNEDNSRASHIDVKPSPYGQYSLDAGYRVEQPYYLDVNVQSPHPEFDKAGLTLSYKPSDKGVQSRVRVNYLPNQEIDSQLKLDWSKNVEGSLAVTTPFRGYESNQILVRHDGTYSGFTCHGEGNVGRQTAQGDIVYKSDRTSTSGSVNLKSPVPGLETVEGNFQVIGNIRQMKGDGSLQIGSQRVNTVFSNIMRPDFVKSSFALYTPYTEDLKISVEHKDTSKYDEKKFESSFDAHYGNKDADGKLNFSYKDMTNNKIDLTLNTPAHSMIASINNDMTGDRVSGTATIKSDVAQIGTVEVTYSKTGPLDNMDAKVNVLRNGESLIDVLAETDKPYDEVHGKIVTKGKYLPFLTAQMDHKGYLSDFNTKARLSGSRGNVFDNEVTFKIDGSRVNIDGTLSYSYNNEDHTHTISINKEGTLTDFKVDATMKCDGKEKGAEIALQTEQGVKGRIHIKDLSDEYDLVGVEIEHSGDPEKFISSAKIILSSQKSISGKVNFYVYELKRIEASAELNTPFDGYKYSKVEYRHEGHENSFTCNVNAQYGENQKISSDLTLKNYPEHSLNFNLKTPYQNLREISVSGDYDQSKMNAMASLRDDLQFSFSGVHDSSIYPSLQYQLTTPFDFLKQATVNLQGQPLDGTADVTVNSYDKTVQGNGELHYTSPFDMSVSGTVSSNIPGLEQAKVSVKNTDDAYKGKTTHVEIGLDPQNQVEVDGRYYSKETSSGWRGTAQTERQVELDVKLPIDSLRSIAASLKQNSDGNKMTSKVDFGTNDEKLLDMDLTYDKTLEDESTAVIHKPWPMEYSVRYQNDANKKEGELYANWNRNEPASNARIKATLTNSPYNNDVNIALIRPSRTMGLEHSFSQSQDKLSSSGKVYWDQSDDSKISYSMDVNKNSRRGDNSADGVFKLGLPSRTLGVTGSYSNGEVTKTADAAFRWDMDRDDSKQIGIKASMMGQDYTKADVSLTLPANFQVDSKVTLNQGDTIFDGQTDISYTRDSRKTLTFFSKVKNVPQPYSTYFSDSSKGFNYSVELGLTHPDTKVDLTIDSHVGSNSDRMTSSLGIKYLTFRRQMKNLALFAEIDKIQKQINLVASGPSSSIGLNGRVERDEPLRVEVTGNVNGEEKIKSTVDYDKARKSVKFEIGQSDNMVSMKAFYPNSSAIQAEILHRKAYDEHQDAAIVIRLINPHLLGNRIEWNPQVLAEIRDFAIEQTSPAFEDVKRNIEELNRDVEEEVRGKYRDISTSVVGDMQPLVKYLEDELESLGNDIRKARNKLSYMYRNNEFHLKDISEAMASNFEEVSKNYVILRDEMKELYEVYTESYKSLIQAISEKLDSIKQYPMAEAYRNAVSQSLQETVNLLDRAVSSFIEYLRETDLNILNRMSLSDIDTTGQLDYIKERLQKLKDMDYSRVVDKLHEALKGNLESVKNMDLQPYKDALNSVKVATFDKIVPEDVKDMTERTSNEIYQQAKWAYNYWDVEEALKEKVKAAIQLLQDIIEDEMKEQLDFLRAQIQNPIKEFDLKKGVLVANIPLPFEVQRLDEMPDVSPYVDKMNELYEKYAPDTDDYSEEDSASSEDDDMNDDYSDEEPMIVQDGDDEMSWLNRYSPRGSYSVWS